jgi:hypothetical protein
MKNKLDFSELEIGMKVKDSEDNIGIIKKIKDIHSILIKFETGTGGYCFYCLDEKDQRHYDPLYKVE